MKRIEAVDVCKSFHSRGKTTHAVVDASLCLREGEIVALLGLNGAGKTTMIKILAGLLSVSSGQITRHGCREDQERCARSTIGAVLEGGRSLYWRMTCSENIEYFSVLRGLSRQAASLRSRELLQEFGLARYADTLVSALSRGMRQRISIIAALSHHPTTLFLDEPTLGVDVENKEVVLDHVKSIRDNGTAILLTSHQLDTVGEVADQVVVMDEGRIIAATTPSELVSTLGSTYEIVIEDEIDCSRTEKIRSIGCGVRGRVVETDGSSDSVYHVLDILRPLKIESMGWKTASFETALLNAIRDKQC